MNNKKFSALLLLVFALVTCAFSSESAQAQAVDIAIPTFGLYCGDLQAVKSGTVKFDLTDENLLLQGLGVKRSDYLVSSKRRVEFAVPFICSACGLPPLTVTVDGREVAGSVWYGEDFAFLNDDFDVEKTYAPVLDESLTGTLYTVIPDSDTLTVSLTFYEKSFFVYETSNNLTSSNTADGRYSWTFKNALSKPCYRFFVTGDTSGYTFGSGGAYAEEVMPLKEFIDAQYKENAEFYEDCGGVSEEFFYAMANKSMQNGSFVKYDDLFFDSVNVKRFNVFKFGADINDESLISFQTVIDVCRNDALSPCVYSVEHRVFDSGLITYEVELNGKTPYMLSSSASAVKNDAVYTASTADGFSFTFSSSAKPGNASKTYADIRTVGWIICGVLGAFVLISSALLIYYGVRERKRKR